MCQQSFSYSQNENKFTRGKKVTLILVIIKVSTVFLTWEQVYNRQKGDTDIRHYQGVSGLLAILKIGTSLQQVKRGH